MKAKNQAVIFARVSSRAQELEGFSLDAQVGLLKTYCESKDLGINKVFEISETASRSNERKKFAECLEYLQKHGITILVIEKVDRLTRNYTDHVEINNWLKSNSVNEVHSIKDNQILSSRSKSQDTLMWDIKVTLAKNASLNLSEEVKKGQLEKLNQGWLPKEPPLGYETEVVNGKRLHKIDPMNSPLVIKAFKMYSSPDHTLASVAETLAKLGLKTVRGKPVSKNTVDRMLDNKYYIGINQWNGIEYKGSQDIFISKSLWDAVQFKKHGLYKPVKFMKHSALLRGMVKCSDCERLIVWQLQKGRYYGRCNGGCKLGSYAREEDLERALLNQIEASKAKSDDIYVWLKEKLGDYIKEKNKLSREDVTHIEKLIQTNKNKLEVLYEDRLEGVITLEEYLLRSKALGNKIEELEDERKAVNLATQDVSGSAVKVVSLCTKALERYTDSKASQELKREILLFYFDNMRWNGKALTLELSELAQLVICLGEIMEEEKQKVELMSDHCEFGSLGTLNPVWQG
jgi:site-specific DNA recombinase